MDTKLSSLAIDPLRAQSIDQNIRSRLADSFRYLVTRLEPDPAEHLGAIANKLPDAAVSPWVVCLYSWLVADLAQGGTRAETLARSIAEAADMPASSAPIGIHDASVPEAWWEHYHVLLDTDPGRTFRPASPTADGFARTSEAIEAAFEVMGRCDTSLLDDVRAIARYPVLAAPASDNFDDRFNGASTFFFWGGTLLNSEIARSPVAMVDLLVHESSHLLLFGLVEGTALTTNDPTKRYKSPLRSDQRPIDGIFHACFVSARVEIAMNRLLESGRLTAAEARDATRHRDTNAGSARAGLRSLNEYANPTEKGQRILSELNAALGPLPALAV